MAFKGFSVSSYFSTILISFLVIETISFLLYTFADIPLLRLGFLIVLSLVIVAISTLFVLGININQMDKNSIIFILIVLGAILALLFFLPKIVPEIFSIYNPSGIEYSNQINNWLNGIGG